MEDAEEFLTGGQFKTPRSVVTVKLKDPEEELGLLTVNIRSVRELSPLDMIDLANGVADATGRNICKGLPPPPPPQTSQTARI